MKEFKSLQEKIKITKELVTTKRSEYNKLISINDKTYKLSDEKISNEEDIDNNLDLANNKKKLMEKEQNE